VHKTGMDTVYQGAVSGQVVISNPQNLPVTVYAIHAYVQGGPTATVSCGSPVPFQVSQAVISSFYKPFILCKLYLTLMANVCLADGR